MRKKNLPLLENITITDVAAEGKALVRVNDCVVFVPYVVPGDVCDLQVTKKKHSFMEAVCTRLITPSPLRQEPVCPHYGTCGGCKWQILPYEEQLRFKTKQVRDTLERIGKIDLPEIRPCLGSQKVYAYRNKLEFTFSDRRWLTWDEVHQGVEPSVGLGFHIPNCFDKVLDIRECHLMDDLNNRIRNDIRQFAVDHNLSFFNLRTQQGLLRNLMMRNSNTGEFMLVVVFYEDNKGQRELLLDHLLQAFPEITSLQYIINQKCNDSFQDQQVICYHGKDHVLEEMEGLQFKVGPKSFYQTNTDQAYELYRVARQFAFEEIGRSNTTTRQHDNTLPLVYDLYTGTGTIANFVAREARQVIGIEYVPEAIEDARVNSAFNQIDNTIFYAGDMKDILTDSFIQQHGRPDVIITDPPRAGMHEDVIRVILNAAPERIVYVSCNPATQARDLQLLDEKYQVAAVQPVDMFPHTQHVENVVLLIKRNMQALTSTDYHFAGQSSVYHGKVRDVYSINNDQLVMVATDRISAFDVVLPKGIPFKGQILNQIAAKFLDATSDIVPNWKQATPDPQVTVGLRCEGYPVEMIVRGYICGSAWRTYKSGQHTICGVQLPDGLRENERLPQPIITPTTKAEQGMHDQDISREEIIAQGLIPADEYAELERITLALYQRGQEIAAKRGLILVDTKYEFGRRDGKIILMDEIHTPDSSRYFYQEGYEERFAAGQPQKQLSKEFVREWLMANGFMGQPGQQVPEMTDQVVAGITDRYVELYEHITGEKFLRADTTDLLSRIESNVVAYLKK